jgi:acetate kinase
MHTVDPSKGIVLVLNAGSSSIKFAVYDAASDVERLMQGEVEGIGTGPRFHAHDAAGAEIAGPRAIKANAPVHELMQALLDWIEHHLEGGSQARPSACPLSARIGHRHKLADGQ